MHLTSDECYNITVVNVRGESEAVTEAAERVLGLIPCHVVLRGHFLKSTELVSNSQNKYLPIFLTGDRKPSLHTLDVLAVNGAESLVQHVFVSSDFLIQRIGCGNAHKTGREMERIKEINKHG